MKIKMNRFYKMDCLEYMRQLPDDSVDIVVTDPPYGVNFAGNKLFNDRLNYVEKNIDFWFFEMSRVLKPSCHIYVYAPTLNVDIFVGSLKKYFVFSDILIARSKTSVLHKACTYKHDAQLILHGSKGKGKLMNKVNVQRKSSAWLNDSRNNDPNPYTYHYSAFVDSRANAELKNHPTAKNIEQIKGFLLEASNEGDVVLDPFAGGMAMAKAAIETGRNFFTCDLIDWSQLDIGTYDRRRKAA